MRVLLTGLASVALIGVGFVGSRAQAADPATMVPSLAKTPANVAFYSASLRFGDQLDRFMQSKAYAALRDLPVVQHAIKHANAEADKPGSDAAKVRNVLRDPANRELMALLHEGLRNEFFFYGGGNWGDFLHILTEINSANQFAAIAELKGENPQEARIRSFNEILKNAGDKLQAPESVFGMRISKPEAALAQIDRLEKHLTQATDHGPLKGRVRREQIDGANALTISIDGSLLPWDEWDKDDADLKELFGYLKKLTVKACVLVKGDYLLVTMGPNSAAATSFGKGPSLAARAELAPLAKHGELPLIGVNYMSEALMAAVSTKAEDVTSLADLAKTGLEMSPLSKERREAILKDVKQFTQEVAGALPKPSASMSCAFLTARGQEGYSYDYGAAPVLAPRSLKLTEYAGGSPLMVAVGAIGDPLPAYQWSVRWLGTVFQHADAVVQELLGDAIHTQFKSAMDTIRPLAERFNAITIKQTLPAEGEGEFAFVIDGKWTSKNWFPELDQKGESLPMLELAMLRTIKDSSQLLEALGAYRQWANDVIRIARESGAPIPEFTIPAPETKKVGDATIFYWPLPQFGQDAQIAPNLVLTPRMYVESLSLKHSERLLTATPLAIGGVRATSKPLQSFAAIDLAGMVGVFRPWIEKLALPQMLDEIPADAPPGLKASEIPAQVKTVFNVIQCLRTVRMETYRDGNANVTRSELVIEDLK